MKDNKNVIHQRYNNLFSKAQKIGLLTKKKGFAAYVYS